MRRRRVGRRVGGTGKKTAQARATQHPSHSSLYVGFVRSSNARARATGWVRTSFGSDFLYTATCCCVLSNVTTLATLWPPPVLRCDMLFHSPMATMATPHARLGTWGCPTLCISKCNRDLETRETSARTSAARGGACRAIDRSDTRGCRRRTATRGARGAVMRPRALHEKAPASMATADPTGCEI